jgi:hypothetical protein
MRRVGSPRLASGPTGLLASAFGSMAILDAGHRHGPAIRHGAAVENSYSEEPTTWGMAVI